MFGTTHDNQTGPSGAARPKPRPHGRVTRYGLVVAVCGAFAVPACGQAGGASDGPALAAGNESSAQATPDSNAGLPVVDEVTGLPIRRERIKVGGVDVTVEIAESGAASQRGLMGRDSLPEDYGMLFVYDNERTLSFWMRNTKIPLDIAFIDRNGLIVDIQQMEPFDEESTLSAAPAMYALEMEQGWFDARGVAVGAKVQF